MNYVDGVISPVPTANKDAYLTHAKQAAEIFKRHGAISVAECWGDEVPEGKINSMHTAVMRKPEESVVFSWIVWPSKSVRDQAWKAIMEGAEMSAKDMPFDGMRMVFGGFEMMLNI